MQLIVIANPAPIVDEHLYINALFSAGLSCFHLRKPDYSFAQMEDYIQAIAPNHRQRVTIHSHWSLAIQYQLGGVHYPAAVVTDPLPDWLGRKSRPLHDLVTYPHEPLSYVLFSPVFDSISKHGYCAQYNGVQLQAALRHWHANNLRVMALGGVDVHNIAQLKQWGFDGVAVLGSIWQQKSLPQMLKYFLQLENASSA